MKRKTLDVIKAGALSAVMIVSLAACGNGTGTGTGNDAAANENAAGGTTVTQEAPAQDAVEAATTDTVLSAATEQAAALATEAAAESATESAAEAATGTAEPQNNVVFENGGLQLLVPEEYVEELLIETPQDDAEGILFKVAEKASVDAAKELHGDEADTFDMGWLFSIGKVTEDEMHKKLCEDMSGMEAVAKDVDGNFYLYYHPTDVRFERVTSEEFDEGMERRTVLNDWANTVFESFAKDNADILSPVRYGNSDVQIYLARIAYMPDVNYTVSTLEYAQNGALSPAGVDAAPYVESLLTDADIDYSDDEAPDGEYIVLNFPDENVRFDFFYLEEGQNYIRRVYTDEEGENSTLYKATFKDETVTANGIMDKFVKALAEANGFAQ